MPKNQDSFFRRLFLVASIYDFVLGFIFLFLYKPVFAFFNIDLPVYPMYLQMTAGLVLAMGIAYYYIYRNLYRNYDLVKLGIAYKIVYIVIASYFYFMNLADVTFFWFVLCDLVFLVLFIKFLMYAKKDGRYLKWK